MTPHGLQRPSLTSSHCVRKNPCNFSRWDLSFGSPLRCGRSGYRKASVVASSSKAPPSIFPRSAKISEKVEKSKGGPLKSEIFDHFEDRVFIKNPEISEFANLEGMGTGDRGPGTGNRGRATCRRTSGKWGKSRKSRGLKFPDFG